ncbi:MAG: hypothetical protein RLZZ227_2884 [Pseudomonadota bacterium]|jgi:hypothetical protein
MSKTRSIHLAIGNALPHGNAAESAGVLALWQEAQLYFRKRPFEASPGGGEPRTYFVTLDAGMLLALMEYALRTAGSFDAARQAHARNPNRSLAASLLLEISGADSMPDEQEAHEVATLLLQQLVVAVNLVQPGALRLLQTSFKGEGAHRYEAQVFDSKLFYGAFRNLRDLGWWQRHNPGFDKVWHWLERADGSHGNTAIKSLDKVLFTLVKVAEQRNELSSRAALLVVYQLEMLLDCRGPLDPRQLRRRLRLILGDIPEAADCITELYGVRDGLLLGSRPVHRPPLICHDCSSEFMENMERQDNAVEMGTALVLVLLRELISRDAHAFTFNESVEFSPFQQD